jgi:hypothetical protein
MTELSGTLDGIGLFPLLNFLATLKSAGRLTISERDLSGTLYFSDGRVVGATFGADSGQVALDAIGLALGTGRFEFNDGEGERPSNLDLSAPELQAHLEQLASERQRIMAGIPSLEAVPVSAMEGPDEQPIALDRASLRLLLRCDGRHSVMELAREGGLLPTLKRLATLHELKLIKVEGSRAASAPEPEAEAEAAPAAPPPVSQPRTPVPEPVHEVTREPAESGAPTSHPRRPWWQGEGP